MGDLSRARPWSARQHTTIGAQAAQVTRSEALPMRPASAMDRLRSREAADPLTGIRKRNLYQAHARRLYSRTQSSLDEQLDMLAASMKRGPERTDHEARVTAMAAHLSKHAREKLAEQNTQAATGYAGNRRRPSSAHASQSIPLHIASERAAESAKAYGHGASAFTRHEPAEVDAEQWLEHMWVAKRTKDMVSKAQEEQVRKALHDWERERDQREQAFENTLRMRMQLRGSTLPMGCKSARKSSQRLENDLDGRLELDSEAQRARMERNLQVFKATVDSSAIPGHPYRQHSASTAEQLRRPKSAAPVRRAHSFKDRRNDAANTTVFVQPPMRFAQAAPSHIAAQRRLGRKRDQRPSIENQREKSDAWDAEAKTASDDKERSGFAAHSNEDCDDGKSVDSSDSPEADALRSREAELASKGFTTVRRGDARDRRLAWDADGDEELQVYETAARQRAPSHQLEEKSGKAHYFSTRTGEELEECKRVLERFDDRGLAGEVSAQVLHRALVTPQDLPFQLACKGLPIPGSTLPRDPALLAQRLSGGVKGKKGKGKKKKGKAGATKKKKKAGAGASSPGKGKKKAATKPKKKKK